MFTCYDFWASSCVCVSGCKWVPCGIDCTGIAIDTSGTVYIADTLNHRIRTVSPTGEVRTLIGTGQAGLADGNLGDAVFAAPTGLAFDNARGGVLLVVESGNAAIRQVNTFPYAVGSPSLKCGVNKFCLGVADNNGKQEIACFGSSTDCLWAGTDCVTDADCNKYTAASPKFFSGQVCGLAIVNGWPFDACPSVRTVVGGLNSTTITLSTSTSNFADGMGSIVNFNAPAAIAVGRDSTIYIADTLNHRVRKLSSPSGGAAVTTTTFAGSGAAALRDDIGTLANFNAPQSVAMAFDGSVLVADSGNGMVRAISPNGGVTTWVGHAQTNWTDGVSRFLTPSSIATTSTWRWNSTQGYAVDVPVCVPVGSSFPVAWALAAGVSAALNVDWIGAYRTGRCTSTCPVSSDAWLHVTTNASSSGAGVITMPALTTMGTYQAYWLLESNPPGAGPYTIKTSSIVFTVATTCSVQGSATGGVTYVSDVNDHRIRTVSNRGAVGTLAGSGVAGWADGVGTAASFNKPQAIALDTSGMLYVVERGGSCLRKVTPWGLVTTVAGCGMVDGSGTVATFNTPMAVAVDVYGTVLVADRLFHRIRQVSPDGMVTTLAGMGSLGLLDGVGTNSSFFQPTDVSWTATTPTSRNAASGSFLVADSSNHAVRRVTMTAQACALGTFGNSTGLTVCLTCQPGQFSAAVRSTTCTLCPAGRFGVSFGLTAAACSGVCPAGFFCSPGSVSPTANPCIPGTYCPAGSTAPMPCANGTYNLVAGQSAISACFWCPAGSYCAAGASSLTVCPVMSFCPANSTLPLPCPFNTDFTGLSVCCGSATSSCGGGCTTRPNIRGPATQTQPASLYQSAGSAPGWWLVGTVNGLQVGLKSDTVPMPVAAPSNNTTTMLVAASGTCSPTMVCIYYDCVDTGTSVAFLPVNNLKLTANPTVSVIDGNMAAFFPGNASYISVPLGWQAVLTAKNGAQTTVSSLSATAAFSFCSLAGFDDQVVMIEVSSLYARLNASVAYATVPYSAGNGALTGTIVLVNGAWVFIVLNSTLGYACSTDGVNWVYCPQYAGQYDNAFVQTAKYPMGIAASQWCTTCAPGSYCPIRSTGPVVCPSGFYCPAGSAIPVVCPIGSYCPASSAQPVKCDPAGYTSFPASTSCMPQWNVLTLVQHSSSIPVGTVVWDAQGTISSISNNQIMSNPQPYTNPIVLAGAPPPAQVGNATVVINPNAYADGIGVAAVFVSLRSLARDTSGNVYVSDLHAIRKITAAGVVTTVAGVTVAGFADGSGTNVRFSTPVGLVVEANGNIIVADQGNARVRRITIGTSSAVVSTIAGSGVPDYIDGFGTWAAFNSPTFVTQDNRGAVFVTDSKINTIRRVSPDRIVSTLVGPGAGSHDGLSPVARVNGPTVMAVDVVNKVLFADSQNNLLRSWSPPDTTGYGVIATEIGNGTAVVDGGGMQTSVATPTNLGLDPTGNLYLTQTAGVSPLVVSYVRVAQRAPWSYCPAGRFGLNALASSTCTRCPSGSFCPSFSVLYSSHFFDTVYLVTQLSNFYDSKRTIVLQIILVMNIIASLMPRTRMLTNSCLERPRTIHRLCQSCVRLATCVQALDSRPPVPALSVPTA
jgi:hypothetical protein